MAEDNPRTPSAAPHPIGGPPPHRLPRLRRARTSPTRRSVSRRMPYSVRSTYVYSGYDVRDSADFALIKLATDLPISVAVPVIG